MATGTAEELKSFHDFISEQLQNGSSPLSPEECLALWRLEQEQAETLQAIREGLNDVKAGRVRSVDDFDAEFRQKHNIPHNA